MLSEHDAAVYRAEQEYEAARARSIDLRADAVRAKHEATQAATQGEVLLADAATGTDVTDDHLLACHDQHRRADALASIAEAKAKAGKLACERAQIALLDAQARKIEATYARCVDRELELTEKVAATKALLDKQIAELIAAERETAGAYGAAAHHNRHEMHPGHHRNETLNAMRPDQQPRAQIPAAYPGMPAIQHELFWVTGSGFNRNQRNVIRQPLSDMRYRDHGRTRGEKADAAA